MRQSDKLGATGLPRLQQLYSRCLVSATFVYRSRHCHPLSGSSAMNTLEEKHVMQSIHASVAPRSHLPASSEGSAGRASLQYSTPTVQPMRLPAQSTNRKDVKPPGTVREAIMVKSSRPE